MNSPEVFYLHLSGEQRGPYTILQIDHLLNSGLIDIDSLYWKEGLEQWQPVTSLVAIRKKPNRLAKAGMALVCLIALAVPVRIFGPIAVEGWNEANQHEFTGEAAYWRARDVVRNQALERGALVEFEPFTDSQVKIVEATGAQVSLEGKVTVDSGKTQSRNWTVAMAFNPESKDWSGSLEAKPVEVEKTAQDK